MNLKSPFSRGVDLLTWFATWFTWALSVAIHQYESQIAIFLGDKSATWSAWALRIEIYQYDYQIIYLIEEGRSFIWSVLSSQSSNLSVWISNCHILEEGRSATWSAWALRVASYQYEPQITTFGGGGWFATVICYLVFLTSQSQNLSVWISNFYFLEG